MEEKRQESWPAFLPLTLLQLFHSLFKQVMINQEGDCTASQVAWCLWHCVWVWLSVCLRVYVVHLLQMPIAVTWHTVQVLLWAQSENRLVLVRGD